MCLNFGQTLEHCKNPQFKIALKRIYIIYAGHRDIKRKRAEDKMTF